MALLNPLRRAFEFLASARLAVPLLILIAAASIVGSLIPQGRRDVFHSWWYLLLLALLGVSLVTVTVKRVPRVWRAQGRGPALGVLLAHAGVVVILVGAIYGALSGFRHYTRIIEGEAAVIPGVPMVIKLDRLDLKAYAPDAFSHRPGARMLEKQESVLTLLHHGRPFLQGSSSPGNPLTARGITLLPSEKEVGWAFDLVLAAGGHERVVTIRPWAPPLITLGLGNESQIMTHRLSIDPVGRDQGPGERPREAAAEIVLLDRDGASRSLGFVTERQPLGFGAWTVTLTNIRRYTGLHVYSRPELSFLIAGAVMLVVGLGAYVLPWVTKRVHAHGRRLTPRAGAGVSPIGEADGELSHVASS